MSTIRTLESIQDLILADPQEFDLEINKAHILRITTILTTTKWTDPIAAKLSIMKSLKLLIKHRAITDLEYLIEHHNDRELKNIESLTVISLKNDLTKDPAIPERYPENDDPLDDLKLYYVDDETSDFQIRDDIFVENPMKGLTVSKRGFLMILYLILQSYRSTPARIFKALGYEGPLEPQILMNWFLVNYQLN